MACKDILLEKSLFKKPAEIKRFEYSSLDSELKNQTDIAKKQHQRLGKVFESNKKEGDETINKDDEKTNS